MVMAAIFFKLQDAQSIFLPQEEKHFFGVSKCKKTLKRYNRH
jgi:hypothetical protein